MTDEDELNIMVRCTPLGIEGESALTFTPGTEAGFLIRVTRNPETIEINASLDYGDDQSEWPGYAMDTLRLITGMVAAPARPNIPVEVDYGLLERLASDTSCRVDHNGDCQSHGFILGDGEECPQARLLRVLSMATFAAEGSK